MKIIQIKGANGSGKTTIVKQLIGVSAYEPRIISNGEGVYCTYMPDLGWAAVGSYPEHSKMGGCDNLKTVANIKDAIHRTIRFCGNHRDTWIVFEGMMISTIKSTFYHFLQNLPDEYPDYNIEPLFVILEASTEGCVERIKGRGTMRSNLNVDNITNKCNMVVRHAKTYDPELVRWMKVDALDLDNMLPTFLYLVGDKELLEMLYA